MAKLAPGFGGARLGRLVAQLTAAPAVTTPPWDMPPPKDFPPYKGDVLEGPVENGKVPVRTLVSADYQREYLLRCGVSESAFRGALDPAMVASAAGRASALTTLPPPPGTPPKPAAPASGGAFVSGRWTLFGPPLRTGEPLTVTVGQGHSEKHPKGTMSYTELSVANAAGEKLMHIQNAGLALDAALVAAAKRQANPAARPEDPKAGKTFVSAVQFTPDMCAGYCYFIPNRIHNEVETAQ